MDVIPTTAEEAPEAVAAARCLRCGNAARRVAWSAESSMYIHAAVVGADPQGIPILCGGEVAPLLAGARPGPRPGEVVPCHSVAPSFTVHLVRLGRLGSRRNGSWRGTALCGATPGGSSRWVPAPDLAQSRDLCDACAMARGAGLAE